MLELKLILFLILNIHFTTAQDLTNCNVIPAGCIRTGITYANGDYDYILTKTTESAQECDCFCKNSYFGKYTLFSWKSDDKKCLCGYAKDPAEMQNPVVVSGRFDCLITENQPIEETAPIKSPDSSSPDECTGLQTECYLPGYDIQGPTTPDKTGNKATPKDCSCFCSQISGSLSFVWQKGDGACWCKDSTQIGVNVYNSLISGIFGCNSTATNVTAFIQKDCPGDNYCPKYGVEYEGSTIVEVGGIGTFDLCGCQCSRVSACKHYFWTYAGTCFLKQDGGESISKSPYGISGRALGECTPPTTTTTNDCMQTECYLPGYDLNVENTVSTSGISTSEDCSCYCRRISGSLGFSWNTGNTWCYCKGAVPPTLTDAIQPVAISGIYNCPSAQTDAIALQQKDCPGVKYCPKYGVEHKGNTIVEVGGIGTFDLCGCQCSRVSTCKHFFWTRNGTCFLKQDGVDGGENIPKAPHGISGLALAECTSPTTINSCIKTECFLPGFSLPYLDVLGSATLTATPQECSCHCSKFSESVSFTWANDTNCWCKNGIPTGNLNTKQISGIFNCFSTDVNFPAIPQTDCSGVKYCQENGVEFEGSTIVEVGGVQSFDLCGCQCSHVSSCTHYFWTQPGTCFLKKDRGLKMFKAPLGISGRVEGECSFPTTKDDCIQTDCIWPGYDLMGNDIGCIDGISSPKECSCFCRNISGSLSFTFKLNGECWCKHTNSERSTNMNAISGIFNCFSATVNVSAISQTVDCIQTECYLPGFNLPGNDMGSTDNISTPKECSCFCSKISGSLSFAWSNGGCWCKDSIPVEKIQSNVVSGVFNCASTSTNVTKLKLTDCSEEKLYCPQHGVDFNGSTIVQVSRINSFDLCGCQCSRVRKYIFF